jgi:hypothetical protein
MRVRFALLVLVIPVLGSHGCVVVVVVFVSGPAVVEYIHGSHKQGGSTRASAHLVRDRIGLREKYRINECE